MEYLLLLYSDEAGWSNLTEAEQEQGVGPITPSPRR